MVNSKNYEIDMKERDPTTHEHFIYKTPRDAVLHDMALNGWANESHGDIDSHVGWFARISNSEAELGEIIDAFEQSMEQAGLADAHELVGHFLVVEQENSEVVVLSSKNERELLDDYTSLTTAYASWLEDQEEVR